MTTSNVSAIAAGINAVRKGLASVEMGAATVAQGVVESWATPLRWSYGKGDNAESGMFSLSELYQPIINENGKADGKAKTAKLEAVAANFGIDWGKNKLERAKLLMMFKRGWRIAAAKQAGVDVRFEERHVSVPLAVALVLTGDPDENGVPTFTDLGAKVAANLRAAAELDNKVLSDAQIIEQFSKRRITCKGGNHAIYGDVPAVSTLADILTKYVVEAGFEPPIATRSGRSNDKGATFVSSLDYVAECLATIGSDEAEVALTEDGEAKLRAVAEAIAAYFANHK